MKTITILRATMRANGQYEWLQQNGAEDDDEDFLTMGRRERQWKTFETALYARIEAGDRARECLPRIAKAIQQGDYDMAMGIILDKFMREDYPEYYLDEQP